jgi:predicted acetyltransferase
VAACLSARRYAVDGGCVIEVVDGPVGRTGGPLRLEGGIDGAECAATDGEADLVVGLADLGALLLGRVSWATLRRAGRVEERTPGAIGRADAMFRPDRAPYCSADF